MSLKSCFHFFLILLVIVGFMTNCAPVGEIEDDLDLGALNRSAHGLSRSPWQQHNGGGVIPFGFIAPSHGHPAEYNFAAIPSAFNPGWSSAPDGDLINYSLPQSILCGVAGCRQAGDFTYFQTFVDIPSHVMVTTFTIQFSGLDDGARVTIFNSSHPSGIVVPGSYVFLGGSGTANLSSLVVSGEVNRIVVTHVDDCCSQSYLRSAKVVLNGKPIPANRPPIANAGPDRLYYVCIPQYLKVMLDGSGSYDPDGDALTYLWKKDGIIISTDPKPIVKLGPGYHKFDLMVKDGKLYSKIDSVIIKVISCPRYPLEFTPKEIDRERPPKKVKATLLIPYPYYNLEDIDLNYRMKLYFKGGSIKAIGTTKLLFGEITDYKYIKVVGYFYSKDILAITSGYGPMKGIAGVKLTNGKTIIGIQKLIINKYP